MLTRYLFLFGMIAGCAARETQVSSGELWRLPEAKKIRRPADLSPLSLKTSSGPRIIYVGVYGGGTPSWDKAEYFDPQDWPAYKKIPDGDETKLDEIAFRESVMHVVALLIGRQFSNSMTLLVRGNGEVVADIVKYLYRRGDKVYLVGHSQGGAAVVEAAHELSGRDIPVELLAHVEGFLSTTIIPRNVVQVLNFFVPATFSPCSGREKLKPEAPDVTRISNIPVSDPRGPFNGFCAEHRNIDSDPRVWKTILQAIFASAATREQSAKEPARR